ncbi:hypothetical protein CEXT_11471 [Caerostris extrusa]|uniref:Uncharacterized protein n=1 Tax=Caerostris extrusa TaxID=172846 RepID=A0AAV4XRS6_CAEEX|nr:hypothetical protein CEXT_11471 [Caerostris extrusa]
MSVCRSCLFGRRLNRRLNRLISCRREAVRAGRLCRLFCNYAPGPHFREDHDCTGQSRYLPYLASRFPLVLVM